MVNKESEFVIITGSSSGIGLSVSKYLSKKNYLIIGIDKKKPEPEDNKFFSDFIHLDMIQDSNEYLEKKFRVLSDMFVDNNKLVAIINNAAYQVVSNFESLSFRDFEESMMVNFFFPVKLIKNFYKKLIPNSGSIVNISSIHSSKTLRGFSAYSASKSALDSLTRSLSIEFGASGIKTVGICPGATKTKMLIDGLSPVNNLKNLSEKHPTKKIIDKNDLSKILFFIISNNIQALNGTIIKIDGGISSQLYPE